MQVFANFCGLFSRAEFDHEVRHGHAAQPLQDFDAVLGNRQHFADGERLEGQDRLGQPARSSLSSNFSARIGLPRAARVS